MFKFARERQVYRKKVTLVRSRAIDPNINKIANVLSKNGYDVTLLLWDRQNTLQRQYGNNYPIYKFCLTAPYDKLIVFFYLPIWWIYEFFFLLKDDSEIIHVCDLDTLIPAIFIKFIRHVNLFYTIYDFYADNFQNKILTIFIAFIEKVGIGFTDILFLVDECRYKQIKGAKVNQIVYIYNSPPDYYPRTQRIKSRTKREITMFYAGLIHRSRGLEFIFKAVKDMDDDKLIIAGIGPDQAFFEKQYIDKKKVIRFIGQIPYERVLEKTIKADILFAFYDPEIPNNKYASPNKLFEAMMCRKPIIVSDGGSMADIVRRVHCGLVVPYGDVEAIKKAIISLKTNPQLCKELGENGRKAYEERYSWVIMEDRLISAYTIPKN